MKTLFSLAPVVAVLGLFTLGGTARAQSYEHVDRLAVQLERQARELHREVHNHFWNTPQFRHLDRDIEQLERLAAHVHEVAHHQGDLRHLRQDPRQLDRSFHHVEGLVEELARSRTADRRTIAHLRRALERMGATLHHLQDDVDSLERSRSRRR